MSDVKRYDVVQVGKIDAFSAQIFIQRKEDPDGPYRLNSDYEALEAKLAKVVEAVDKACACIADDAGIDALDLLVEALAEAAREGEKDGC